MIGANAHIHYFKRNYPAVKELIARGLELCEGKKNSYTHNVTLKDDASVFGIRGWIFLKESNMTAGINWLQKCQEFASENEKNLCKVILDDVSKQLELKIPGISSLDTWEKKLDFLSGVNKLNLKFDL